MPPKRKWRDPSQDSSAEPMEQEPKLEPLEGKYVELFKESVNEWKKKQRLFQRVVAEENWYRELFAQQRDHQILSDPHLLLVDVHDNLDIFNFQKESPEEANLPKTFPLSNNQRQPAGLPCVVDQRTFKKNFDVFTEGQLKFLKWDNVFVAGGSVLAALMPPPGDHGKHNQALRQYYHKLAYKNSDVDLFIYGIESEEEANKKLEEIYFDICEAIPEPALCFRSQHAVTIVSQYPYRHIQIILRLYKSPAEILMGFDVDACSVGYDGNKVWVTPRAHRALTHQYNCIDMSRRSPTYEMRLAKYSNRGFAVVVPTLDRSKIDPQLFERRFDQLQGLARLLLLEKLSSPEARYRYKEQQRLQKLRPLAEQRVSLLGQITSKFGYDDYSRERMEEQGGADASDYSTVFLPWGPKWTAEKVRKLMYTKDMILNSKWYDPSKKYHTHPCFFGTASEVIKDCCGACPPVAPEDVDPDSPYVSGKLTWVTVNPGAQAKIGSFHPITEGDWTEGAFISVKSETLCIAVNADDAKTVQKCLNEKVDVNGRDPVGRTPLHIAAFSNSMQSAKILLKSGAKISNKVSDAYGHADIVKLILDRAKEIEAEAKKKSEEKTKKAPKKPKKPKRKLRRDEDEDEEMDEAEEMDEDEEMDDDEEMEEAEENEEEEKGEGEGEDEDGDGEFTSIKARIEQQKLAKKKQAELLDPSLDAEGDQDLLDINQEDWDLLLTPLHYAVFFGHKQIVQILIDAGADIKKAVKYTQVIIPLMHLAIINGHVDVGKLLLENGLPINQRDLHLRNALHIACEQLNFNFVKLLVDWKKEKVEIDSFSQSNHTPLISTINAVIQKKANEEDKEVQQGIEESGYEIVEYLVVKGNAKVHYLEADLPPPQQFGNMAMGFGFGGGQQGNDRQRFRGSVTQPIFLALDLLSVKLIEFLLDHKADVNWINNSRATPLNIVHNGIKYCASEETNAYPYQKQQLHQVEKQMKKLNSDSFLYNELSEHAKELKRQAIPWRNYTKTARKDGKKQKEEESEEDIKKEKERKLALFQKIELLLTKRGGVTFVKAKLSKDDAYLKDEQQRAANLANADTAPFGGHVSTIRVIFNPVMENFGGFMHPTPYGDADQKDYLTLFEACKQGDIKTIENLTIKRPIGKQLHVCSNASLTRRSPLHVAMEFGQAKTIQRLLEIAVAQYTSPFPAKAKKDQKVQMINNYDLVRLMGQVKPGQFMDNSGRISDFQVDPNDPPLQLNCVTSVAALLKHRDSRGNIVLHVAKDIPTVLALLKFVEDNKISNPVLPIDEGKKKKPDVPFIEELLAQRTQIGLSPLELAIARGYTDLAAPLLERGGLNAGQPQEDEDEYEGLDVGGKKMDWALEHRAPEKQKPSMLCIHLAAHFNQVSSIKFLLSPDTHNIWKKSIGGKAVGKKNDPKVLPEHFDVRGKDDQGRTAFHIAVANNSIDALKYLLSLNAKDEDKAPYSDYANKDGITPLHIAVNNNAKELVQLLLAAGSDVSKADTTRGWTALHFAAWNEDNDCIPLLLARCKPEQVNAISKFHKQTPLMIAAYYGNIKALKLITESQGCNIALKDVGGDFALHHATKNSKVECVKTLHSKDAKNAALQAENGVGLTPLDCAMMRMTTIFHSYKHPSNPLDPVPDRSRHHVDQEIFDYLSAHQAKRILANSSDVRSITEIMLNRAKEGVEARNTQLYQNGGVDQDVQLMASPVPAGDIAKLNLPAKLDN